MGNVVPFKQKPSSPEREALRQRLQRNADDLQTLAKLFPAKKKDGLFALEIG
jgi:hypothetical protein